jgi:hypothetical protein
MLNPELDVKGDVVVDVVEFTVHFAIFEPYAVDDS